MGRVLAIDYGLKRTGIAVSDPLRIIATPLDTVETSRLLDFLKEYISRETVDAIVIGEPKTLDNKDSSVAPVINAFVEKLKSSFPTIPLSRIDERFTSSIAKRSMIEGGMKKKDRRDKANVDKISATLILQDFLAANG